MTYADDRELRREVYTAFVTRASETGPNAGEFDNAPVMEEILALRRELAELLASRPMPTIHWPPRWPTPRRA